MKRLLNVGVLVYSFFALSVSAAPINWGAATDVENSGRLMEAFNAGGSTSGSDQTVNGVPFAGTTALLDSNTDLDVFSPSPADLRRGSYFLF